MEAWTLHKLLCSTRSVYRALDPRLTYSEHLRYRIEENEHFIELHESRRSQEPARVLQPSDADATKQQLEHMRERNEKYRAILRWEEAMDRMRDAHSVIFQHWLELGTFGLDLASLKAYDAAEQEFRSAMAAVNQITDRIWASHPLGAIRGKLP
jgi:hypothetical protein